MNTEKITQYLEQMAAKLGVAAEHVYGLLIRQQVSEGVVWILGGIAYLVVYLLLVRLFAKKCAELRVKKEEAKKSFKYVDDRAHDFWLFAVLGGFAAVLAVVFIGNGILHLMNPEYYAIREIMDVIGGVSR